jgi:hypothetical protein
MIDKRLIPYSGVQKQKLVTTLDTARSASVEVMPPATETIAKIKDTNDNIQKALPGEILTRVSLFLGLFKTPEQPLEINFSKTEFEASKKFINIRGSVRENYRSLVGLFGEKGMLSHLALAHSPAFSKADKVLIDRLKSNINESDQDRLNYFVKVILTIGESFEGDKAKEFRKDPSMKALLAQITDKVNNNKQPIATPQESESISTNEYIRDFDIDNYSIELLRAMKFILERFISKPNNDQVNTSQPKLK